MWFPLLIETGLWQASLKAEDILNSWPETEVGRILRVYGEESNWYSLQNKIVKARSQGGLHSTSELVDLIRKSTPGFKGKLSAVHSLVIPSLIFCFFFSPFKVIIDFLFSFLLSHLHLFIMFLTIHHDCLSLNYRHFLFQVIFLLLHIISYEID